jgi:hypothetical protein
MEQRTFHSFNIIVKDEQNSNYDDKNERKNVLRCQTFIKKIAKNHLFIAQIYKFKVHFCHLMLEN